MPGWCSRTCPAGGRFERIGGIEGLRCEPPMQSSCHRVNTPSKSSMTKWHWGVRCGLAIACLFAWRLLTEVPVPGLTNDAVTRQLQDYRLRDISIAYVGVRPLVDVMLLLFMVTSLSQR